MSFEKIIDAPRLNRFKTKILNLVYQKGDVYNKNEIDNKFSQLETNIDWKEAVATYNDIATTYPNPVDGWTVNVKDTDYTYRYNGTKWVAISANAIPKATNNLDGLLSKEDHANYEDANSKKHTHSNKSVIDGISSTNVSNWNSAKTHADSTHARTDATKVEASTTNGNIKINGTETNVYTHPSGTNPHGTTKIDVGLGEVGNFKAVSTVANQGLTDTEKSNARANIGAGTSSFSGSYNDLTNKPTIPTVGNGTITIKQAGTNKGTFTMNQSGNTTIELTDTDTNTWRPLGTTADTACAGNDSRLSNARPASDVYAWAKASSKPSYSYSEISGTPSSLPANGGTSTYANNVWTQSHNGSWYINSNWNGTHFVTNAKSTNGSTLPIWVNNSGYADSAGNADTLDGNHASAFASSSHTHNYAGSSSAGGSATSAVKLDSSAGSATQPVYFSGGKPVACTYTLGKSVPSNAVFTDTNTWRSVTTSLTSTSTDVSLAASAGKSLQDQINTLNSNFVKIKTKEYTIKTGTSLDIVSQRYHGSVNTSADKPNNCVAIIPIVKTHPAYENCDATIAQFGDTICVNHRNPNESIVVTQIWLYTL